MKVIAENAKWLLLITLLGANLFIWNAVFAEERGGLLTVAFLDVGQGDAIQTHEGRLFFGYN